MSWPDGRLTPNPSQCLSEGWSMSWPDIWLAGPQPLTMSQWRLVYVMTRYMVGWPPTPHNVSEKAGLCHDQIYGRLTSNPSQCLSEGWPMSWPDGRLAPNPSQCLSEGWPNPSQCLSEGWPNPSQCLSEGWPMSWPDGRLAPNPSQRLSEGWSMSWPDIW